MQRRNAKTRATVSKETIIMRNSNDKTKQQKKEDLIHLSRPMTSKTLRTNTPFPPYQERNLVFQKNRVVQAAAPYVVYELEITSWKPDAVNLPSGFDIMAQTYNFYRAISLKFHYNVASNEPAVPVKFGMIVRDIQPSSAITSYQSAIDSLETGPCTGTDIIGQQSGYSIFNSVEHKIDLGSVVGNRLEYLSDQNYRALTNAVPNQAIWLAFVLVSYDGTTNLTNGAFLEIHSTIRTQFYSNKSNYG